MSLLTSLGLRMIERGWLPDAVTRLGIRRLCRERLREESRGNCEQEHEALERFIARMNEGPIAPVPEKANEQHYELPPDFFSLVLGQRRKYSSCFWPAGVTTLDAAEEASLAITCERAQLADGQRILELGCGWGSLSLYMAQKYPRASITAVSNAAPQRRYIEERAAEMGLTNLRVITCDMNEFDALGAAADPRGFDRVVSVEMFEHMRNWRELLHRISTWLTAEGKLFIHIFVHRRYTYAFETEGDHNWLGRYFFTGGIMPSDDLPLRFQDHLSVTKQWRWSGTHYEKTANAWLKNLDERRDQALPILAQTHGEAEAQRWLHRWRVFLMACAELWGYRSGQEWWVSHYLWENRASSPAR